MHRAELHLFLRAHNAMTPDQLISAFALLVEEVCQSAIKMRVVDKPITPEEWTELEIRFSTLSANFKSEHVI